MALSKSEDRSDAFKPAQSAQKRTPLPKLCERRRIPETQPGNDSLQTNEPTQSPPKQESLRDAAESPEDTDANTQKRKRSNSQEDADAPRKKIARKSGKDNEQALATAMKSDEHGQVNPNGPCKHCQGKDQVCRVHKDPKKSKRCARCVERQGSARDCNLLSPEERAEKEAKKEKKAERKQTQKDARTPSLSSSSLFSSSQPSLDSPHSSPPSVQEEQQQAQKFQSDSPKPKLLAPSLSVPEQGQDQLPKGSPSNSKLFPQEPPPAPQPEQDGGQGNQSVLWEMAIVLNKATRSGSIVLPIYSRHE
ncbi:hypothetical protein GGR57DRAFT_506455 [Xylariaceae sp. FL1272]|nr:hypothetical protein GGR57DRAFT_506455 [Xylariaceae sp. FL1272]